MSQPGPKLWTKNFSIITWGSVVSMMGNTVAGFAISLMVLDYTQSTFLYTLYIVAYNLPKLIMPLLAGPWLDRFSRKKAIYGLDFLSAGIYLCIFFLISGGLFSYGPFLLLCILIGAIDSTYLVAYDSLYPTLVAPENFRKAYAISSVLTTLSMVVAPLAAYVYEWAGGAAPLFLFNTATFLIAAIMETRIDADEAHIAGTAQRFSLRDWGSDFREGMRYIRGEPGLMVITVYFFFINLTFASDTLSLPYFRLYHSVMDYMVIMAGAMLGRVVGGRIHYSTRMPAGKKFDIARLVYIGTALITGTYLFLPKVSWMAVFTFFNGLLGVTSYNIRIASTQTYVPNSHRARFNGSFQMVTTLGTVVGQLACGALAEVLPIRGIYLGAMVVNLVAIFLTMGLKGRHVRPIYNMDV